MPNLLLTGGRSPVALELARVFAAAGHRVLMAESLPDHLSQPSRAITAHFHLPPPRQQPAAYLESLRRIVIDEAVDLLVPTCEEIFTIALGRDALAPHCTVFVEPIERLRVLHHKALFIERARVHGLSVPETVLLENTAALREAFGLWPSLVLKPAFSRFASQTVIAPRSYNEVRGIAPTREVPWVAQRFLAGDQVCTYSVVHGGHVTAHTAYRADITAGQGAAIHFRHLDHPKALAWVESFVKAENFTGQIAFDFIEGPDGVSAIECNPRAVSGAHLLARAPGFAGAFFDAARPRVTPPDTPAMLLTAMLAYGLPSALKNGTLKRWWAAMSSSRDVVFRAEDPLPFLLQGKGIARLLRVARRLGITPLEASTYDIEWNGP